MLAINQDSSPLFLYSFRSQKTNWLQRDEGMFIQLHGASREVINSGRVLGFSTSPRDIDGQKSRLLREHPELINRQITNAIKVGEIRNPNEQNDEP